MTLEKAKELNIDTRRVLLLHKEYDAAAALAIGNEAIKGVQRSRILYGGRGIRTLPGETP